MISDTSIPETTEPVRGESAGASTRSWRLPRRIWSRVARTPRPLLLILAVGLLQSIAWDVALPAFQGPDEAAHFAYVQYLAENGRLPSPTKGPAPDSREASTALVWLNLQATIGDLSGKPAWSSADLHLWQGIENSLPGGSRANGSGPNAIAKNPPLYYAVMAIPYRVFVWLPLLKRIFVLRLFNALFYLATIALSWLIAGELFGRVRWKQTLAAGVVALLPQLAYMSAVINADSLLIALTTAALLTDLRLVARGPSLTRVLGASLVTAAAALTHGRGLVTVPMLATALIAALITHRVGLREAAWRGATAAGTLLVAGLAYLRFGKTGGSGALYGGQVSALTSGKAFNIRQFLSSIYQFYFPRLPTLRPRLGPEYGYRQVFIDTFYGTFGSLEVLYKPWVYDVLQVLSALGLVSLYTAVVVRWRRIVAAWPAVIVMLSLLVTNLFFLHYVSYRSLLTSTDPLIVGRYLLPMISLFGLAIAFTVGCLPHRAGVVVGAIILVGGVLLSLTGIGITAARFYA